MEKYKYPKTFHLPISRPDPKGNDRAHHNYDHFLDREVICTEKMDGENFSLGQDYCHARSLDSAHHPSRTWIKAFHANIRRSIPEGYRLCGENLQAKHAIFYNALPTFFLLFGVYNQDNVCLSWDDTLELAEIIGVKTVPVLYRGKWDQEKVHSCFTGKSAYGEEMEGYVVRIAESFHYDAFSHSVSKFVRPGHVAGDAVHWSKTTYKPNKLV